MLAPALLNVADRLIATLMTLVDAVHPIALAGSTPTFPNHAAQSLFFRLAQLVTTLIRISNFGVRAPAKPTTSTRIDPADIAQRPPPRPAQTLPRRPGWLLDALPDIAPAIAADLRALLADPALTTLLAAAPTLHRTLCPLLRSLGLAHSPPSPDTSPPRPAPTPSPPTRPMSLDPASPPPPRPSPPPKLQPRIDRSANRHSSRSSLRFSNKLAEQI